MPAATRPLQKLVLGLIGSGALSCAVYDSSLVDEPSSGPAPSASGIANPSAPPFSAEPQAGKGGMPASDSQAGSAGTSMTAHDAAGGNGPRGGSAGDAVGGSDVAGAAMSQAGSGSEPDPLCNTTAAKEGRPCSQECVVPCGFRELGTKTCTCTNGVYSQCSCPRPAGYQGAPTAGHCDTPDGSTLAIDETACSVEWAQCIGTDPVSGVTPRGCACITDPELGIPAWVCQSTNGWFVLAPP